MAAGYDEHVHKAQATERSSLLNPETGHQSYAGNDVVENGEVHNGEDTVSTDEPSTSYLILVLGSVWVGCFLNAIDSTIVATLAVPISDEFGSLKLLSWLATSYMIAQTALTPLSGRLTDILGRRAGLVFSNVAFGLGTLMCGLATDEKMIIGGRVIAGMGGGGLNSISTFIASDLIPLRRRGVWQGVSNICWGVGASLGGIYGGWIHDIWGWRWAFLTQVPLIFLSMVLVIFTVKIPVKQNNMSKLKRIDFLGSFLLVTSLVLLLLGLNTGGNILPWGHSLVILSLSFSLVFLVAFVYVEEYRALEPIIPIQLILIRTVAASCLTNWFDTMVEYVLHFYGPIYFQILGYNATKSGSLLIPQAIGVAFGSICAGYIMRVTGRYWALNIVLELMKLVAAVLMANTASRTSAIWPPFIYYFICGFSYAGMLTTALVALISSVDQSDQALVTSASYTVRFMGSAVGIAITSTVFQNMLKRELWARFGDEPGVEDVLESLRASIKNIQLLPPSWREDALDSYMAAVRSVWFTVVVLSALGLVASTLMRQNQLHTTLTRK